MAERHVLPTPEEVAVKAAEYMATLAEERVQKRGRFTVALAGGSTPRRLYETARRATVCGAAGLGTLRVVLER